MEMEVAMVGLMSSIIGLLSALLGRKKVIEQRIVYVGNSGQKREVKAKWYDYRIVVAILIVIIFPVGFYALYKNRTIGSIWKWVWVLVYLGLFFIGQ